MFFYDIVLTISAGVISEGSMQIFILPQYRGVWCRLGDFQGMNLGNNIFTSFVGQLGNNQRCIQICLHIGFPNMIVIFVRPIAYLQCAQFTEFTLQQ